METKQEKARWATHMAWLDAYEAWDKYRNRAYWDDFTPRQLAILEGRKKKVLETFLAQQPFYNETLNPEHAYTYRWMTQMYEDDYNYTIVAEEEVPTTA